MFQPIQKSNLDPAIVQMETQWRESGVPDLYEGGDGPVSRERARNVRSFLYPKPKLPHGKIESATIPGDAGDIAVRIVRPVSEETTGTLVYFHGGGWVLGDLDSHEAHAIRIANCTGLVVLNVDYRLAPENRFPAAYDDAVSATVWATQHLDKLGGVGKPLAVGGDSAGGNLAAAVAVYARDSKIDLKAQLLLYPCTNMSGRGGPEIAYLGDDAVTKALDPRASPLRAKSLAGLAHAIIAVGSYDFLYEDNMNYANALRAANVEVDLLQFPDLSHGFFSYTAISKSSEKAAIQACEALKSVIMG